jgi:hypothetical protein
MIINSKVIRFLLLIPGFMAGSRAISENQSWQRISHSVFIMYFQDDELQRSQKILNDLQSSYSKLSQELSIELIDSVFIFLAPSKQVFDQLVGKNIPRWTDGIASPTNNIIILKSPTWLPSDRDLHTIATHELVHILLDRSLKGNPIPRWFNEGLAVYYSGEKGYASSTLVSKALITNSLLSLSDIDDVLSFNSDAAQLAYQQSYLAVVYLFKNYGPQAVSNIIFKVAEGKQLNQAFIEVIDHDLWEFEQEWFQYIKQKYRWHFLVEFDNYLWVLILALFVLGFIIIRRRNRRIIQQWHDEDEDTTY